MATIEERIVSMKFDAQKFIAGAKIATSTLAALKTSLNLDKEKAGIDNLETAGNRFSLKNIADSLENISGKFSALGVVGVTALANITSKAVDAGLQLAKSLSVDQISGGFEEYNTNLNAIQTTLANTMSKGTSLDDVNKALAELNTYSDKTIYNFSEMAKNIGTFTAAGVDLKTSTTAIKGISNLAALSGSSAEQASTGMYQLSQAISTGTVRLEDWNSVQNAGFGGEVFQKALIQTAKVHGVKIDEMIKKDGSFRNSLQENWLSAGILTETLSTFTGDLSKDQLKSMGYTEQQTEQIMAQAKAASDAATVVKTLPQLMDTLKESVGSGWTNTFQILFGNFDEAKKLFTGVYNSISPIIQASANARNNLLASWKDNGGRDAIIEALANSFHNLMDIVGAVGQSFRDVFPPLTGEQLANFSKLLVDFTAKMKPSADTLAHLRTIFIAVFDILDFGKMVVVAIVKQFAKLIGVVAGGSGGFLDFLTYLSIFVIRAHDFVKDADGINQFFEKLGDIIAIPIAALVAFGNYLTGIFTKGDKDGGNAGSALDALKARLEPLAALAAFLGKVWDGFMSVLRGVAAFVKPFTDAIGKAFSTVGAQISDSVSKGDFSHILDIVNIGLLGGLIVIIGKIKKILGSGLSFDIGGTKGLFGSIKESLEGVTGVFSAMQQQLKANVLIKIAIAIGIITASVVALSLIDSKKLASALSAMTVMFGQLFGSLALFTKLVSTSDFAKLPLAASGLILLAVAIDILVIAVVALSKIPFTSLVKGLGALTVMLALVIGVTKKMETDTKGLIGTAFALGVLAVAINILVQAVQALGAMSVKELIKGLGSVAALLVGLTLFTKFESAQKGAVGSYGALILLAGAIYVLGKAAEIFAKLSVKELVKGIGAIGILLAMLAGFSQIAGGGLSLIGTGAGLILVAVSMNILADAVGKFGDMSWQSIGKGMAVMAASLLLIAAAAYAIPITLPITAAGLVIVAAAMVILSKALVTFGGMSWSEIAKGLTVLAASLLILAVGLTAMLLALPGAAALVVAAFGIAALVPALLALGSLDWGTILKALGIFAVVVATVAVAAMALSPLIPIFLGLGAALIVFGLGIALAGVGILALGTGLAALAGAGAAGAAGLTAIFKAIVGLIPAALEALANGIVAFADVIGQAGPTFVQAISTLITSLATAVIVNGPLIITALTNIVSGLLTSLNTLIPQGIGVATTFIIQFVAAMVVLIPYIANAGLQIITGLLNALAARMPGLVAAGAAVIISFVKGIGDNAGSVADAAAKAVIKFLNGVADAIRNNTAAFQAAGRNIATAIADGLTGGLAGKIGDVANAAAKLGKGALDAAKNLLGIHSPSKEFEKVGVFSGEGLINGLDAMSKSVSDSGGNLGSAALASVNSAIAGITDALGGNVDLNPTITPVLDLSQVAKEAGGLNAMLKPASVTANTSYSSATSASDGYDDNKAATTSSNSSTAPTDDKPIVFNQYNTSPTALSEVEIYRKTNNQLSAAKGVLTKP